MSTREVLRSSLSGLSARAEEEDVTEDMVGEILRFRREVWRVK